MKSKKEPKLQAIVAPKQKKVKIMLGSKILKVYNFKMDIPNKRVQRIVFVHDYNEWCVADRDYSRVQDDLEWDKETIEQIQTKSLEYYNNHKQCH